MLLEIVGAAVFESIASLLVAEGRRRAHGGARRRAWSSLNKAIDDIPDGAIAGALPADLKPAVAEACADQMEQFLRSNEYASIVYQTFLLRLCQDTSYALDPLSDEHMAMVGLLIPSLPEPDAVAAVMFSELLDAVDRALAEFERDVVIHPDIRESAGRLLLDLHLSAINRNLRLLSGRTTQSVAEMESAAERYARQVAFRSRNLTPPSLASVSHVPIDSLYVPARLLPGGSSESTEAIPFNSFIDRVDRTVVLGDPGGGKSTLSQKVAFDLAREAQADRNARLIPVPIVVRDFGAWKSQHGGSVLDFIVESARSVYEVEVDSDTFEYLLLNGRCVVLFDGLDELLDSTTRREMAESVEAFSNLYPNSAVLVTSRQVGYGEAPLDRQIFETFHLQPLDPEGVRLYVENWFSLDPDLNLTERESMIESFLEESRIVSDLRKTPLLLALLCNIYRGEQYIPRNRPEVYQKCAYMLFERWDQSRGIRYRLSVESQVKPAMMYLAYQIYTDASSRTEVTLGWLRREAIEYLMQKGRFESEDDAGESADELISFCTGRAWVFTDVGSTVDGEPLYEFTHRTFLEYFAAAHVVRMCPTSEALSRMLLPRLEAAEWDVLGQLALQMHDANVDDGASAFLRALLERIDELGDDDVSAGSRGRLNLASFGARCLAFCFPSNEAVEGLAAAAVGVTSHMQLRFNRIVDDGDDFTGLVPLAGIMWSHVENLDRASAKLAGCLADAMRSGSVGALLACGQIEDIASDQAGYDQESFDRAVSIQVAALSAIGDWQPEDSAADLALVVLKVRRGLLSISDMIALRGPDSLWERYPCFAYPGDPAEHISVAATLIQGAFEGYRADWQSSLVPTIPDLAAAFLAMDPPFFTTRAEDLGLEAAWEPAWDLVGAAAEAGALGYASEVCPGHMFVLCVLLGASLEVQGHEMITGIPLGDSPMLLNVVRILEARTADPPDDVSTALTSAETLQVERLEAWVRNEVSFVHG